MTTSLALALLLVAALTAALGWTGRRAWQVYRDHFGIEGPVWMVKRGQGRR